MLGDFVDEYTVRVIGQSAASSTEAAHRSLTNRPGLLLRVSRCLCDAAEWYRCLCRSRRSGVPDKDARHAQANRAVSCQSAELVLARRRLLVLPPFIYPDQRWWSGGITRIPASAAGCPASTSTLSRSAILGFASPKSETDVPILRRRCSPSNNSTRERSPWLSTRYNPSRAKS